MNYGVISQTNSKGQLVIPKSYRDALGIHSNVSLQITLKSDGLYIRPIDQVITKGADGGNLYLQILDNTAGSWARDNWRQTQSKRRAIEIMASKQRKNQW